MDENTTVRFLSGEWFARLESATATASPTVDLTVRQRVTGGPGGDVEYTVRLANGTVRFEQGPGPADVELMTDYETAAAISQGRLSPASAFAAGRLRIGGSVSTLVASHEAFAGMAKLIGRVAEETTY
jgi:hypothetical protein